MSATGPSGSKRRERFHGAFTGGFSAGFYNTVGSAEGWTPSSFSSSRNKRAAPLEQRPEDFMDESDGLLTEQLQARQEFDTLGSTANEFARRLANSEAARSTIPGPAPSEFMVSVGDSMGKRLLRTMGWKEGQGVGSRVRRKRRYSSAQEDESPERDLPKGASTGLGKKALELIQKEGLTFAPHNTDLKAKSVVVKSNVHGVGYDPFNGAPEFGSPARRTPTGSGIYSTMDIVQRKSSAGAGNGAISALAQKPRDASYFPRGSQGFMLDDGEDDVYEPDLGKEDYDGSLDADGGGRADESRDSLAHYSKAWASEGTGAENEEVMLSSRRYARCPSDGRLPPPGFVVARRPYELQKYWAPPIPTADFKPSFRFEEDVRDSDHRYIPKSQGRNSKALDASGRGRLLGEVRLPAQGDTPLAQGSSALSFLPPVARKKLLEAASKERIPGGSSSQDNASPSQEAISSHRNKSLQVTLANRFTSETTSTAKARDNPLTTVDGLAGPVGLTLRTSVPPGATNSPSTATIPAMRNNPSEAKRNPVRSTFGWNPAPLLCKRLNVPVPNASSTEGLASKGKLQSGGGASVEQIYSEPSRRFTSDLSTSTRSNQPKVPLLHRVAETFPYEVTPLNGAPAMPDQVSTENLAERPSVDLFRSIFESESESESDECDESDGGRSSPKATDSGSPPPATHDELERALQTPANKSWPRRGYGSDSSEEGTTDSALPIPSVAHSTNEGVGDKGDEYSCTSGKGSCEKRSYDGVSEVPVAIRQNRGRNEPKRSGDKRKRKHKHSSKRKDKSERKYRKHGRKRSSSRK